MPRAHLDLSSYATSLRRQIGAAEVATKRRGNGELASEADAERDASEESAGPRLTDLGNAQRLVENFGDRIMYLDALGGWYVWNGQRWTREGADAFLMRRAADVVRQFWDQIRSRDFQGDDVRGIVRHALRSESRPRLEAAVALARHESGIERQPGELDVNPWLVSVPNGTVDLQTGRLRAHKSDDLISKLAGAPYDPDARAPTWDKFLRDILPGPLHEFLQRYAGYALTGLTSEQALVIAWGTGANGKTTLLEALRSVWGDYARTTGFEMFLRRRECIPNDLARLVGARLVCANEAAEGRQLSEATIKALSGGDTVAARFLHREWFEFKPCFKILLATNHRPTVRETTHALWRRLRLLPFTVTIPEGEQDRRLLEKLERERAGILAWGVEGCLKWQREGLSEPPGVLSATAAYRDEQDLLAGFLRERCEVNSSRRAWASELYAAYREHTEAAGERAVSQRRFGGWLTERGFELTHDPSTRRVVRLGLSLCK